MKRKIYFIVSGAIQIFTSIYAIITANNLVKQMIEQIKAYPEQLQGRMLALFENSGSTYILVIAAITIFLNCLIICMALSDKIVKKKKTIISFSIISLLCATYAIIELLAIVNIIVLAASKREKPEDFPNEKEKLPVIKKEKVDTKKIVLAIILLGIYFSQFIWKDYVPDNITIAIIVSLGFYLLMIVLSIVFFHDLLKENFKLFRENFRAYIDNLIGDVGKFYLIYFVVATAAMFLAKSETSINQTNVESLPIWFSLPLAVIYAPIVEETLFRGCIRRFIKNDKIFIVVSAIAFGLLHTAFSETNIFNVIVLAIPYMTIGGFLAYLYQKTNNMCTNMMFHAFHNTIAMVVAILINGI